MGNRGGLFLEAFDLVFLLLLGFGWEVVVGILGGGGGWLWDLGGVVRLGVFVWVFFVVFFVCLFLQ